MFKKTPKKKIYGNSNSLNQHNRKWETTRLCFRSAVVFPDWRLCVLYLCGLFFVQFQNMIVKITG